MRSLENKVPPIIVMIIFGAIIFIRSPLTIILIPAFMIYMNKFQIESEERAMADSFGNEYVIYKEQVRRWL